MKSLLIADSGSSKTDWTIVTTDGSYSSEWQTAGINPFFQDANAIRTVIKSTVYPQLEGREPGEIAFYGAGCADPTTNAPLIEIFAEQYPQARISVESDLLGAARGLCLHEMGIACILGTGANNGLYDGTRIIGNIGSLGFWMGDEGSGGYLGKQLVILFLQRELPEHLSRAFAAKYPEVNRLHILDKAYRQPFPNRYFASFTHFLSLHGSDEFISTFLENAFVLFLKKYVTKHPDFERYPVSFTGSVAWVFRERLIAAMEKLGIRPGLIEQKPMPGLIRYHLGR